MCLDLQAYLHVQWLRFRMLAKTPYVPNTVVACDVSHGCFESRCFSSLSLLSGFLYLVPYLWCAFRLYKSVLYLQELSLDGQDVNQESLKLLAPSLKAQVALTRLELSAAWSLDVSAAEALQTHLSGHKALAEFQMNGCGMNEQFMQVLARWFRSLPALRNVTFDHGCRLTSGAIRVIDDVAKDLACRCRIRLISVVDE